MPNETYPFTAFNFEVQLRVSDHKAHGLSDPLVDGEFAECDGLEMTMEPKTLKEGGNNTSQVHLVGQVTYGNLTLKRGMTANLDLWNWFSLATSGPTRGLSAEGTIVMRNERGAPRMQYELAGCLPIKLKGGALNAKDGQVAVEELQLVYGSLSLAMVE